MYPKAFCCRPHLVAAAGSALLAAAESDLKHGSGSQLLDAEAGVACLFPKRKKSAGAWNISRGMLTNLTFKLDMM